VPDKEFAELQGKREVDSKGNQVLAKGHVAEGGEKDVFLKGGLGMEPAERGNGEKRALKDE